MKAYLDTSVVVSLLTDEIATAQVYEWFRLHRDAQHCISEWAVTEFAAAISMKARIGQIQAVQRASVMARFAQLTAKNLPLIPVEADDFRSAAQLCAHPTVNLRAADALHLAICRRIGATLVTLDQPFAAAALETGTLTLVP
ncbi:type II toxin-antitoxin system VapC family toxin [Sandaracinobacteroides saxicola]|uniref:Ribonuclease VapC n=1 Tax=Sandaracinobacteroides saxicola TaxID=2759707 RepID=A0A7G5IGD4_9SPHN|nr:type II toxin-antitoxin system VapC family toxin [Sandaracinobacteroides saxicola]QMW22426.1 type II toxin-antitoxin system VapC family toxin [Sandaracinobacteroides saxicola]